MNIKGNSKVKKAEICQKAEHLIPVSSALPLDGPGFDSRWERCKKRTSCPFQGTVNRGTVSN